MYRKLLTAALAAAVLSLPAAVLAGTITLLPDPPDLGDLHHQPYYVRGPTIEGDLTEKTITGAILRFDDVPAGCTPLTLSHWIEAERPTAHTQEELEFLDDPRLSPCPNPGSRQRQGAS